jgi:hypothetical protein
MKRISARIATLVTIVAALVALSITPAIADGTAKSTDSAHGALTTFTDVNDHLTVADTFADGYGAYSRQVYNTDLTGTCVDYAGTNTSNLCSQASFPRGLFLYNACLENNHGTTVFNCSGYTTDHLT